MDLLIISEISLGISIVAFFVIGFIKLYNFVYSRGYSHGHHAGFTYGLYRCHGNNKKPTFINTL